jgi:hypothetical protein
MLPLALFFLPGSFNSEEDYTYLYQITYTEKRYDKHASLPTLISGILTSKKEFGSEGDLGILLRCEWMLNAWDAESPDLRHRTGHFANEIAHAI